MVAEALIASEDILLTVKNKKCLTKHLVVLYTEPKTRQRQYRAVLLKETMKSTISIMWAFFVGYAAF